MHGTDLEITIKIMHLGPQAALLLRVGLVSTACACANHPRVSGGLDNNVYAQ